MNEKKRRVASASSFLAFILLASVSLAADNRDSVIDRVLGYAKNTSVSPAAAQSSVAASDSGTIPDWLKRTSYGIYLETKQEPRYYLETVQPLYQSGDKIHTFFTHERISIQDKRGTYSAGFGYRRLLWDEKLLAGFNTFFDYQDLHRHYRGGGGFEAIGKYAEFRSNAYFAASPKRQVEDTSGAKVFEKAVNGGDAELGAPLPFLPWIKVFGSYYRYDFTRFKDMSGWKMRTEFKPFKFVTLNYETYDDNKGKREYRMDGRFTLKVDDFTYHSILSALDFSKEAYPDVDLKEKTLDRVERNFNIQVEKWVEKGTVIEIRRGN